MKLISTGHTVSGLLLCKIWLYFCSVWIQFRTQWVEHSGSRDLDSLIDEFISLLFRFFYIKHQRVTSSLNWWLDITETTNNILLIQFPLLSWLKSYIMILNATEKKKHLDSIKITKKKFIIFDGNFFLYSLFYRLGDIQIWCVNRQQ